ncbi:MAG: adenylyl-sulfate kinase, partial [Alphaproteobacteria bacterium]|nr:adenylyl-sulfate kinase [Alphaproteobacteria bacterium]
MRAAIDIDAVFERRHRRRHGARAELKAQQAAIVWFTGLSGAGKSTIANRLEQK